MSPKCRSFSLPQVSMREAAASKDATFERMESPIWELRVYHLDKLPSVASLWPAKNSNQGDAKGSHQGKQLKTADALYLAPDGKPYFIEFKAQPSRNVEEDDIRGKAFESLYAAALSVLGDYPMETIRANAEFIVVFKQTSAETWDYYTQKSKDDFMKLAKPIQRLGNLLDAKDVPIFFNLDRFKKAKFYRDVHTFDKEQFEQWATQTCLAAPPDV